MQARGEISNEIRRANDQHQHWVPVVVIAFLFLLTYLWTDWMASYPPPGMYAAEHHEILGRAFSSDNHLKTSSWMHRASNLGNHEQRRVLLLMTGLGFLLAYYLPVQYKKHPLIVLTCFGVSWVLGLPVLLLFLSWHLIAYINFHAPIPNRASTLGSLAIIACGGWLSASPGNPDIGVLVVKTALTTPLLYLGYSQFYHPLLQSRAKAWIHALTAHSSLVFIAIALSWNSWVGREEFLHPLGWLLFFWQWERVVMYSLDLKDGGVPQNLKLSEYLATFFSPATFSNFHWLSRIPLGYSYLNNSFFARDKNRIVLSGVWLITLSIFFFAIRPVFLKLFRLGMEALGMEPIRSYGKLLSHMEQGLIPDVLSVWMLLLYTFMSFYLLWTAVAHLKVGLWRLFGYDIEPYFQKPFLSTNLVEFWKRYSYYYREFLVRVFYYPVFLRFFKKNLKLRIFVATFAAAGFGNMLYHVMYDCLYYGITLKVVGAQLRTFPYYVLLGIAIATTQVWLLRRRGKRRPWTWGWKIGQDILAVIGTIGLFILIRPFHHVPLDHSIMDSVRLVFAALGVHW